MRVLCTAWYRIVAAALIDREQRIRLRETRAPVMRRKAQVGRAVQKDGELLIRGRHLSITAAFEGLRDRGRRTSY